MNWSNDWSSKPVMLGVDLAKDNDKTKMVIVVYIDGKPVAIDRAEVIGDLTVHESLEVWGKWAVSHVPTQAAFMKAVPTGAHTKEQLINWCRKVQETFQDEWTVLRSLNNKNYLDDNWKVGRAKDIIQAHCLNTKVE